MGEVTLEAAVEELYAAEPARFVARRDELARQARTDGDRALAARIKALRRPTVGAWYLNSAARAGLGSVAELISLGADLREAQAAGDFTALRELAGLRNRLVASVVAELSAHLAESGTLVTPAGLDEVRATLASALADPEVAAELSAGRLDRAHTYSGFGDLPAAVVPKPAGAEQQASAGKTAAALAAAKAALASAEGVLREAAASRAAVAAERGAAADRVESLARQLAAAREDLAAATADLAEATELERLAAEAVDRARAGVIDT